MTAATAPPWPGSRALLGWWRELASRRPVCLAFSQFLFHRVECLVQVAAAQSLDPWQSALLRLIHARIPGGDLENALADLRMDRQLLARFVRELTDAGLLHTNGAGVWRLTDAGHRALETGARTTDVEERRTFYFLDHSSAQGPPRFVPLRGRPAVAPVLAPESAACSFDGACLQACIGQTAKWKARHNFPADVTALLRPRPDEPSEINWRRVLLDTLEPISLALIRAAGPADAPAVLGFAVRAENWALDAEPALTLGAGWEDVLLDFAEEPPPEAWRQAWQAWCQPRGLPPAEVDACRLERVEHRLIVHAPSRLIEHLRTARSDASKQEAWLLAGSGRTRFAARIELMPP